MPVRRIGGQEGNAIVNSLWSVLTAFVFVWGLLPASAAGEVLASQNGASIERRGPTGPWVLASGAVTLQVGFDARGELQVQALAPAGGKLSVVQASAEATLRINGREVRLANANALGTRLVGAGVQGERNGLRLDLTFSSTTTGARITRSYACYPQVPVVEMWTTVSAQSAPLTLVSPATWHATVLGHDLSWMRGLQAPEDSLGGFSLEHQSLASGESFEIDAQGRSTETALPWFVIDHDGNSVFGGLMWSGRWAMTFSNRGGSTQISALLQGVQTQVTSGKPFKGPRGFLGVVAGADAAVAAAMRTFVVDVVREGRGFEPLVTYNTWFAHGTRVDARVVEHELETAARLGVELFQLDAGWYEGSSVDNRYDFSHGLGAWRPDADRFPDGIKPLVDLAHGMGMRFGLWVEPERVDLASVGGADQVEESWLATNDGRYMPDVESTEEHTAQICLAHPGARQWVIDQLTRLIEENGLDYLKWDNNAWVDCNRTGHGHGPADGDLAHVQGLYEVLAELRSRFPSLLIENCSGGGNRIDLGLAQYTDVAWMDDRSAPSSHVRHNLQGLSTLFPPAYLLSYVMTGLGEQLHDPGEIDWIARSRMLGVLGLTYRSGDLGADDFEALGAEIDTYKRVRGILSQASAALLTDQVSEQRAPSWDATMVVTAWGEAVVFAFQNDGSAESVAVFPVLLVPEVEYEVVSVDGEPLARALGSDLMANGIELRHGRSHAQVVLLVPHP